MVFGRGRFIRDRRAVMGFELCEWEGTLLGVDEWAKKQYSGESQGRKGVNKGQRFF